MITTAENFETLKLSQPARVWFMEVKKEQLKKLAQS